MYFLNEINKDVNEQDYHITLLYNSTNSSPRSFKRNSNVNLFVHLISRNITNYTKFTKLKDVNETCLPIDVTDCTPCVDDTGYLAYYKAFQTSAGNNRTSFYANKYDEPTCTNNGVVTLTVGDPCNPVFYAQSCYIYGTETNILTYQFSLSSQVPITVSAELDVYLEISRYKATLQGELSNIVFHISEYNDNESRINSNNSITVFNCNETTIFTSIGELNFGETYEHGPFSFIVTQYHQYFPLPIKSNEQFILFSHFKTATVLEDDYIYNLFFYYDSEIQVYTDANYNLNGLQLTNVITKKTVTNFFFDLQTQTLYFTDPINSSTICPGKSGNLGSYSLTYYNCNLAHKF